MYLCILTQQLQCVPLVKTAVGVTGPEHACNATVMQSVTMNLLKPCLHPLPRTRWRLFTPKTIIQRLTHTGIFMSMSTVHLCLKNRVFPMTACNFSSLFKSLGIELGSFFFSPSTCLLVRNLICQLCNLGAPAHPINISPTFSSVQLLTKVQFTGDKK